MALKKISREQAHALRDSVEREILAIVNRAMKAFITDVRRQATTAARSSAPNVLLAAGSDEMPTLGEIASQWATRVDTEIMAAIEAAYERVFRRFSDQDITIDSPQMSASRDYIAQVRDRLVVGTHFSVTVYDESFDKIRTSLAQSAAEGWSRDELAERIAAELSWDKDSAYWRKQLANTDKKIDDILDALGEPGTPAREHARLNDPRVKALRADRNTAIKYLDDEKSVWRDRATLIARTESTGANNYGAHQALTMEGVATKVWLATDDRRTRASHAAAEGQEVGIDKPFNVGGSFVQFPGDPQGPVDEVANCRCALIGGGV